MQSLISLSEMKRVKPMISRRLCVPYNRMKMLKTHLRYIRVGSLKDFHKIVDELIHATRYVNKDSREGRIPKSVTKEVEGLKKLQNERAFMECRTIIIEILQKFVDIIGTYIIEKSYNYERKRVRRNRFNKMEWQLDGKAEELVPPSQNRHAIHHTTPVISSLSGTSNIEKIRAIPHISDRKDYRFSPYGKPDRVVNQSTTNQKHPKGSARSTRGVLKEPHQGPQLNSKSKDQITNFLSKSMASQFLRSQNQFQNNVNSASRPLEPDSTSTSNAPYLSYRQQTGPLKCLSSPQRPFRTNITTQIPLATAISSSRPDRGLLAFAAQQRMKNAAGRTASNPSNNSLIQITTDKSSFTASVMPLNTKSENHSTMPATPKGYTSQTYVTPLSAMPSPVKPTSSIFKAYSSLRS